MTDNHTLVLNPEQTHAVKQLKLFLNSLNYNNFLLMGPAGSGKTTVIVNAFNPWDVADKPILPATIAKKKRVIFSAFTNKATNVLRKAYNKYQIDYLSCEFMTIHNLLKLEPNCDGDHLSFLYDENKMDYLREYDVLVFDECSTISRELYSFVKSAYTYVRTKFFHSLKLIFLGDYYQLPPPGDSSAIVFDTATENKWPVSKLSKVMRSANPYMEEVNQKLLAAIQDMKRENVLETFAAKYPQNMVTGPFIKKDRDFVEAYMTEWLDKKNNDVVMLTYTKKNCERLNEMVQEILHPQIDPKDMKFFVGDRLYLNRPAVLCLFYTTKDSSYFEYTPTEKKIYNGEIYDILQTRHGRVKTLLNRLLEEFKIDCEMTAYFDCQLLTIKDGDDYVEVPYIRTEHIEYAKKLLTGKMRNKKYKEAVSEFYKLFPSINYGYAMTIYKAQGSEWSHVFIQLPSIKYSMHNQAMVEKFPLHKRNEMMFKSTYTAITRASENIQCIWY